MPETEDGIKAEVVLNPLGVLNRLNLSQIQELYINQMSNNIVELMKKEDNLYDKSDLFFKYMKYINKEQYDFLELEYLQMNRAQQEDFIEEVEREGIFIHQPPFFGVTDEDAFVKIYKEHPEWCRAYKFKNIEKPLTMGEIYFIRLKHECGNKNSMCSANTLNTKNLPAKSNLKKERKILYSHTPLRVR